jgi:hypothetical protein
VIVALDSPARGGRVLLLPNCKSKRNKENHVTESLGLGELQTGKSIEVGDAFDPE